MDKQHAIVRLTEISDELFTIANSLAGNETGIAAASLHGASGRVNNVVRMLKTGITMDDRKAVLREHFKNQIMNKGKSDAEIEFLVERFAAIAWLFTNFWQTNLMKIKIYREPNGLLRLRIRVRR